MDRGRLVLTRLERDEVTARRTFRHWRVFVKSVVDGVNHVQVGTIDLPGRSRVAGNPNGHRDDGASPFPLRPGHDDIAADQCI